MWQRDLKIPPIEVILDKLEPFFCLVTNKKEVGNLAELVKIFIKVIYIISLVS